MPEVGSIFVRIGADASGLTRGLADAQSAVRRAGQQMQRLGSTLTAALTLPLAAAGVAAVKMAADMEQTRVAFTTLVGSAEDAGKVLKEIEEFAASTPFQFPELADASRKLIAFGVSADQSVVALRRIGDVAAGVGAPIGEIAELYGKARVQGRLFAEDINQLTGRGIPIIQELAKQFGVADSEVRKLVESGAVGFGNIEQAFVDMTSEGGKFFELMQAQSQTLSGRISTLKDNVGAVARELGEELLPALSALAEKTLDVVKSFRGMSDGAKQVGLGLGGLLLVAGPVLSFLGKIATNMKAVARVAKGGLGLLAANPVLALTVGLLGTVAAKFGSAGTAAREAAARFGEHLRAAQDLRKGLADLSTTQAQARIDAVRDQTRDAVARRIALQREINQLELKNLQGTEAHAAATRELVLVNQELTDLGRTSVLLSNRYAEALDQARSAALGAASGMKATAEATREATEEAERYNAAIRGRTGFNAAELPDPTRARSRTGLGAPSTEDTGFGRRGAQAPRLARVELPDFAAATEAGDLFRAKLQEIGNAGARMGEQIGSAFSTWQERLFQFGDNFGAIMGEAVVGVQSLGAALREAAREAVQLIKDLAVAAVRKRLLEGSLSTGGAFGAIAGIGFGAAILSGLFRERNRNRGEQGLSAREVAGLQPLPGQLNRVQAPSIPTLRIQTATAPAPVEVSGRITAGMDGLVVEFDRHLRETYGVNLLP